MSVRPPADDLDLLRGLVEIPSTSRREGEAVEWLVGQMSKRGFRATVDDAGNAVGEIGDGATHVVLLGHIDTVPGEIPVRIEGDELVGRGAVDAKGPLAAFVAAASRRVPGVRVTVVAAVEEESPTSAGARHRATTPAPDWCVIGEPSGWDGVTVGYKGSLQLCVSLSRDRRHGAAPGPTISEEALAVWERLRAGAISRTPDARGFARLDCRLLAMNGGASDGLAETAELHVGYRLPPGVDGSEIEREAIALTRVETDIHVAMERISFEPPVRTARASPLARAFARAIADAGGQTTFKEKSGTSDMNILSPVWGCPMVAYGPGDSRYDHTPMERLALSDYARAILVIRGVLGRASDRII
jgi:LysW-gamma-L-lysine carboxypeptidase